LAAAQEVLEHVIQGAPDSAEAHAGLGALFLAERRYEDAARQSGRAVQLAPASAPYSMQLAEALLKWQNYPTALAFLKAVKARFGDLPDYQYRLAWALYGLHRVPEAAAVLQTVAARHPGLDLIHYSLGNCYLALSRLEEAERQYRSAIQLNPKKGAYYGALGQVLRKEGNNKIDEAIVDLRRAIQLAPADSQSKVQLALCYEEKGEFEPAHEILRHLIQDQPDLLAAHRVLARVYYREGDSSEGNHEAAIVSRLDAEQLRRRARRLEPSTTPEF
jgi:tetratricopeptide (TPR) repeat protein